MNVMNIFFQNIDLFGHQTVGSTPVMKEAKDWVLLVGIGWNHCRNSNC